LLAPIPGRVGRPLGVPCMVVALGLEQRLHLLPGAGVHEGAMLACVHLLAVANVPCRAATPGLAARESSTEGNQPSVANPWHPTHCAGPRGSGSVALIGVACGSIFDSAKV